MKEPGLDKLFKKFAKGEHPNFLDVMEAIEGITNSVTLDSRPGESFEIPTVCELNGRKCCGD
jgi:hypothetical protein